MNSLDIVPSYIKIFDKYDNCKRFIQNGVGKSRAELNGYFAVSILCYEKALAHHKEIEMNLDQKIKEFFSSLKMDLGSNAKIREYAENYFTKI